MKRILAIIVLASLVVMAVSAAVLALASGPPTADTWVEVLNPDLAHGTEDNLWTRGDTVNCTTARRAYLKWSLADVPNGAGVIANATLTLFVNGSTGDFTSPRDVTLFEVTDDNWNDSMTWNSAPAVGNAIQTLSLSSPTGSISNQSITFSNPALVAFLDAQANGDDVASFAVVMTGNCTAGSVGLRFDSVNKVGGVAPDLQISNPNAVSLRTFRSDDPAVSPVIFGGAALILLVAVAGIVIARRRRLAS